MKLNLTQQPPFTIKVELSEGCNLGCNFCGLRGIRPKGTSPYFFMTVETAEKIAKEIKRSGWKVKMSFSMHGEPTLNPNIFEIISNFRKYNPDIYLHLISNSYGIVNHPTLSPYEYVKKLSESGIDNLILDIYDEVKGDWRKVWDDIDGKDIEIDMLRPGTEMFRNKHKFRAIFVEPIKSDEKNKITRKLSNHTGAAAPLDFSKTNSRCAMPFREMVFRHDGNVSICCDDYWGQYPIGNINDMKIEDIWNHEKFQAARIMLYNRDRTFKPCFGCNNVSPRVGLLPDGRGQEDLPSITPAVRALARSIPESEHLASIKVSKKYQAAQDAQEAEIQRMKDAGEWK